MSSHYVKIMVREKQQTNKEVQILVKVNIKI
jgi:hypothetical protein